MAMIEKIQYRVIPITRFQITRYEKSGVAGGVVTKGEYNNFDVAYEVAYALCKAEHERFGGEPDDCRFSYPEPEFFRNKAALGPLGKLIAKAMNGSLEAAEETSKAGAC